MFNMNKTTIVFACLVLLISACKEVPPVVDFAEPILLAKDTTYVTNDVPTNVDKTILIEDLAGVNCVSCPSAAKAAKDIKEGNEGRVSIVTLHPWSLPLNTGAFADSKHILNSDAAERIFQLYQPHILGLPAGGIDRYKFDGQASFDTPYQTWAARAQERLAHEPMVDLSLEVLNPQGRELIINSKTTFLSDNIQGRLVILLTESHLISKQKNRDDNGTAITDYNYEHNYVLRENITNTIEGVLLTEESKRGTVVEKGFTYRVPEDYVLENCDIVALVQTQEDQTYVLLQSAEAAIQ